MDAQVDNVLGDSITYKVGGVAIESSPGVPTIPGFLGLFADDGGPIEGINPAVMRWQLKVAVSWLPAGGPSLSHTVESPKLGVVHRAGPWNKTEDGRYYIIDLQKAP